MQKNQIEIITRHTKGGSWKWGKDLTDKINKNTSFEAHLTDTLGGIIKSHFFVNASLVHSAYPLVPKLWKKPFILTIHGNFKKEGWRQRFFYPRTVAGADIITVPSNFLKNELNFTQAIVIPNAIDFNEFKSVNLRQEINIARILTVMQFNFWHKAKGIIEITKILNELSNKKKHLMKYTVVGDGPERQKIERIVKRFKSDFLEINFIGFDDPKKYFSETDIFAYCSGFDNMPIVILEAMASGLPVISNQIGAISEIITNGIDGLISSNPEDYKYNLNLMLEDSLLRLRLGRAAREKIKEKFDWSMILPQWFDLYKSLLK